MSSLPLGRYKLQLKFFLLTLFGNSFLKKEKTDPALLNLHRRKCEISTVEVTLLSLPVPLPSLPLLPCPGKVTLSGSALPKPREERNSVAAERHHPGRHFLLASQCRVALLAGRVSSAGASRLRGPRGARRGLPGRAGR